MSAARSAGARQVRVSAEPSNLLKMIAEGLGTAFLVFVGCGAVASTTILSQPATKGGAVQPVTEAQLGFIGLAFAVGICAAAYTIGKVSGAHVNPAITIGFWATRRIGTPTAVMYIIAQLIGAVVGALGVVEVFGTRAATLNGLGATAFASPTNAVQAMFAEAIGTFVFMMVISSMANDSRSPAGWGGLIIGLTLAGIIFVMGSITGASLNPARTFGPYLIQALFGGKVDWSQIWVYIVGPIIGSVVAVFAYDYVAQLRRG